MSKPRIWAKLVAYGLAFIGAASTAAVIISAKYMDNKLHEYGYGYKYGPARHLEYLSQVAHKTNAAIESASIAMYSKCSNEDAYKIAKMEDEALDRRDPTSNKSPRRASDAPTTINK